MVKKCVNVKKRRDGTCPDSALDIFSFGHVLFGLMAASFYLLIAIPLANEDDFLLSWVTALSVPVSVGVAFIWEVLERTIVSKYVYKREFGQAKWCESTKNSIADIIIVIVFFYVVFIPGMTYATDILPIIILIIVLQVPILILVWRIKDRC